MSITDVSSEDTSNPEDIQCIIYGNSCPGGQQVMSALDYAQGGNQPEFMVSSDPNQSGHKEDSLQNPYTVGYLEQFVGRVFEIGIDVNTAGGKRAERLLEFLVQVNSGSGYVTTHFYAHWDQAFASAENFFVWRGPSVSVPEPSTIALMLAGLGILTLGTRTRRRRQQVIG